uniref:Uncharacterized protein n=1 Tax=Caenorhabditis tropicalis TaxID=1561998 RepID=A0A1I7UQB1_9PELO
MINPACIFLIFSVPPIRRHKRERLDTLLSVQVDEGKKRILIRMISSEQSILCGLSGFTEHLLCVMNLKTLIGFGRVVRSVHSGLFTKNFK